MYQKEKRMDGYPRHHSFKLIKFKVKWVDKVPVPDWIVVISVFTTPVTLTSLCAILANTNTVLRTVSRFAALLRAVSVTAIH
jgi:hypothetical protein